MASKFDVKTDPLFKPPVGRFEIVDVPAAPILAIDGSGDPNTSPLYTAAVGALYAASYGIKFASKAAGRDLVVAPQRTLKVDRTRRYPSSLRIRPDDRTRRRLR